MPSTLVLVIILLAILAVGGVPYWPHMLHFDAGWGPSSLLGALLVVLLVFWLLGAR